MSGLSKAELIDELYRRVGPDNSQLTKTAVRGTIDELAKLTRDQLASGHEVSIPNLVKLSPTEQAARTGRNPATGEEMDIPARTAVKAKVAKSLRDAVR